MRIKILLLIIGLMGIVCIIGCNIFSWASKTASTPSDIPTLLYEADIAKKSGDYSKAMEYYLNVISKDPKNSRARYGYSSACIQNSGTGILTFIKITNVLSTSQSTNNSDPFGSDFKNLEIAVASVVDYVDPIADGQCDGVIAKNDFDININLSFAYMLKTLFVLLDPPNGKGGKMRFNFTNWNDKSWDIVISDISSIKSTDDLPNVVLATTCIDKAVDRVNTALQSYQDPDSRTQSMANTLYEVKNYVETIKTELANIQKQIDDFRNQYKDYLPF